MNTVLNESAFNNIIFCLQFVCKACGCQLLSANIMQLFVVVWNNSEHFRMKGGVLWLTGQETTTHRCCWLLNRYRTL